MEAEKCRRPCLYTRSKSAWRKSRAQRGKRILLPRGSRLPFSSTMEAMALVATCSTHASDADNCLVNRGLPENPCCLCETHRVVALASHNFVPVCLSRKTIEITELHHLVLQLQSGSQALAQARSALTS